jgi:hypothetical protein
MTVYYILSKSNAKARFITTYQERSSKRNIFHLLEKFHLDARQIMFEATPALLNDLFKIEGKSDFMSSSLSSIFLLEFKIKHKDPISLA